MDLMKILGIEQAMEQAKKESPQERYARIDIDLGEAAYVGKDIPILIDGDYLSKIKYDGTATGTYFKFDNKRSSIIYASEFRKRHTPFIMFKKIYLTNPVAQNGKHFILFVGGAFAGEIEPSTGIKTGLTDADGVDITPSQDKRDKAHTFAHVKPTTMTTANTAQALVAASKKVKWAIIHFQAKVALIGDSTVTRGGGAADGQTYEVGSYLSVEYVDLNEIYIINSVLGEKCIYSITYAVEAV